MAADAHDEISLEGPPSDTTLDPDPYPLRYVALTPGVMERLSPVVQEQLAPVILEQLARIEAKLDLLLASRET